ncbi:hypothetical protein MUP77_12725, partial [Candidatus Bathyarchaeota archaeon]|nr:hypothetical protein [Candidatus Bathyarchaeota archaeon]
LLLSLLCPTCIKKLIWHYYFVIFWFIICGRGGLFERMRARTESTPKHVQEFAHSRMRLKVL